MKLRVRPHVPVLRGLNFEVKPNQYVALVGPSGCGKTTCISLLERFYDPQIGQVIVDGTPIADYHLADYRSCISLVSQEPTYDPDITGLIKVFIKGQFDLTSSLDRRNPLKKIWNKLVEMQMFVPLGQCRLTSDI